MGWSPHRRESPCHVFFIILKVTRPKRKRSSSNHPFSGANMLVSERVWIWIIQLRQPLKYGWLSGTRYLLKDTVDGRNPANQLRLVVYPMIYKVSYIPGSCLEFLPSTVGILISQFVIIPQKKLFRISSPIYVKSPRGPFFFKRGCWPVRRSHLHPSQPQRKVGDCEKRTPFAF